MVHDGESHAAFVAAGGIAYTLCRVSDPVYLVSRCSSMEEFVAAFRRYADRLGVFVPSASPVAVGKKGRFAITLRGGGVVVEGDAEVIMSSTRASGLHGRPGMTLRFAKVDDDSRAVLDHLEKVRFGAKVTVASDHLKVRPGPAQPDPGPAPAVKAGTDPAQALAECLVVGDAGAPASGPVSSPVSSRTALPGMTTPAAAATARPSASVPSVPSVPPATPRANTPPPIATSSRQTMMGPAIADPRAPAPVKPASSGPNDAVPRPAPPGLTVPGGAATVPTATPGVPTVEPGWLRHTTKGVAPPGTNEAEAEPALPRPMLPKKADATPTGAKAAAAPPRAPTPPPRASTPSPIAPTEKAPLVPAPPVLPTAPSASKAAASTKRTMMGLQALPKEPGPSAQIAAMPSTVEESTQPTATVLPGFAAPEPEPVAPSPAVSIEIDPALMEPTDTQAVIDPHAALAPIDPLAATISQSANIAVPAIASAAPGVWPSPQRPARVDLTDAGTGFFQDTGAQPKIGNITDANTGFFTDTGAQERVGYQSEDMTALVQASSPRQKRVLVIVVTSTAVLALAFVALAVVGNGDKGKSGKPATTAVATTPGKGSAVTPTAGSAATPGSAGSAATAGSAAIGAGSDVAAPVHEVGDGSGKPAAGSGDGSAAPVGDGSSDGSGAPAPPDGPDVAAIAPPVEGDCTAKVSSSPSGADVFIGGKPRGKTPVTLSLPCSSQQLSIKLNRYETYNKRMRMSSRRPTKVSARLKRPMFTVKVSSVPSGATISIGGKKAGKTPSAVKVPGYDSTTITLFKDGYVTATERVTAKQNGTAIKMTLRRR